MLRMTVFWDIYSQVMTGREKREENNNNKQQQTNNRIACMYMLLHEYCMCITESGFWIVKTDSADITTSKIEALFINNFNNNFFKLYNKISKNFIRHSWL